MQDVCAPALPQLTDRWNKSQFHLTQIAEGMQERLGNDHFYIVILGFRPGSVIADFVFVLLKEEATDVRNVSDYLREVVMSKFGNETEVQGK